jgi:hypothetical protein
VLPAGAVRLLRACRAHVRQERGRRGVAARHEASQQKSCITWPVRHAQREPVQKRPLTGSEFPRFIDCEDDHGSAIQKFVPDGLGRQQARHRASTGAPASVLSSMIDNRIHRRTSIRDLSESHVVASDGLLLKCTGVVLPGGSAHPIATFDKIRPRLRQIFTDKLALGVCPHR